MSIIGTTEGSTTVDFPIYHYSHGQPAGRSIIWLDPNLVNPIPGNVDWMRIVAVYVDEPYNEEISDDSDNCNTQPVAQKKEKLRNMAAAVRAKAPSARFWVNFRGHDIDLIGRGCSLNQDYIDVVSMDVYGVEFDSPELGQRYWWLLGSYRATEHQQLALVPGTFTVGPPNQSGDEGASRLTGFFDYANTMNQSCWVPLGPQGRTGIFDGCPVWMVAGFLGGTQRHRDCWGAGQCGPWHYPIDYVGPDSDVSPIRNKWRETFLRRRVDMGRVDRARMAVPQLFDE